MMAEWKQYNGSPEQIAEMRNSKNCLIFRFADGTDSAIYTGDPSVNINMNEIAQYLICEPHPLADMIIQQAKTGQPVWVRLSSSTKFILQRFPTHKPDWNIPGAEYSFKPFDDKD